MAEEVKEQKQAEIEKKERKKKEKTDFDNILFGRLPDLPAKTAEKIYQERKKTSEATYVTLSPKEFAERKEGYIEEDQPAMEVASGEEILDVEHPLNKISTDVPQGNEAEQITEIMESGDSEILIVVDEEKQNEEVDETVSKTIDETEEETQRHRGKRHTRRNA